MGTRGDEYRAKYSSVDPKIEQASTRAIAFVLEEGESWYEQLTQHCYRT
jgi:hypothetical protein